MVPGLHAEPDLVSLLLSPSILLPGSSPLSQPSPQFLWPGSCHLFLSPRPGGVPRDVPPVILHSRISLLLSSSGFFHERVPLVIKIHAGAAGPVGLSYLSSLDLKALYDFFG